MLDYPALPRQGTLEMLFVHAYLHSISCLAQKPVTAWVFGSWPYFTYDIDLQRGKCCTCLVQNSVTAEKILLGKICVCDCACACSCVWHVFYGTMSWQSIFCCNSVIYVGPLMHNFYIWLDKVIPKQSSNATVKRIILDRFIFAPPFLLAYFWLLSILEV